MVASRAPPTGDLASKPVMCPDWELNRWPFGSHASPQSTEPHQPGQKIILNLVKFCPFRVFLVWGLHSTNLVSLLQTKPRPRSIPRYVLSMLPVQMTIDPSYFSRNTGGSCGKSWEEKVASWRHLPRVRFLPGLQAKAGHYAIAREVLHFSWSGGSQQILSARSSQEDPPRYPHSRSWSYSSPFRALTY